MLRAFREMTLTTKTTGKNNMCSSNLWKM